MSRTPWLIVAVGLAPLAAVTHAEAGLVVPFTEDFDTDAANWFDLAGTAEVGWVDTGGPLGAGDAYISTDFAFADAGPFGAILFRAQDEFNSSDNAFVGDWIAGGVDEFSFWFRHDAPAPVPVFARFSGPLNFPGAAGVSFVPVLPDVWTEVIIPISPRSPNIVLEGGTFADVFSNVGHVQIGVDVPDGLEGDMTSYAFDVDTVSITPTPAAWVLLLLAGARRRRGRAEDTAAALSSATVAPTC